MEPTWWAGSLRSSAHHAAHHRSLGGRGNLEIMNFVDRTDDFVTVGYFLSAFGAKEAGTVRPPSELRTQSWQHAYATFYSALSSGRTLVSFSNSLKATRDAFDAWVDSGRKGWRLPDGAPKPLSQLEADAFERLQRMTRGEVWSRVARFADLGVGLVPASVLSDLDIDEPYEGERRTEGGRRVVVSSRVERDPSLRAAALHVHGHDCMVCGFNFGRVYGSWGEGYAEVHHLVPLGHSVEPRETDPARDLAVLCANCHRMAHRKQHVVLAIDELRARLASAGASEKT